MPSTNVLAPVSGTIGDIRVTEGQAVRAGDVIIVEYAAKTESNVTAPAAGRIKLLVEKGAQANQGDRLAEIES